MPILKKFNINFFKKWTAEMAYVLGFFCADGSMDINPRGSCYISFHGADKELIEGIKRVIKSEHKLSVRVKSQTDQPLYRLQIGSKELFGIFEDYCLSSAKAKVMRLPSVPEKYLGDFVRGYFDGDGNVWVGLVHKERQSSMLTIQTAFTSASRGFLGDLKRRLETCGIKGALSCKKTYFRLSFSVLSSLKLYDLMYGDLDLKVDLFLKRKKVVFEKFIKMRS